MFLPGLIIALFFIELVFLIKPWEGGGLSLNIGERAGIGFL